MVRPAYLDLPAGEIARRAEEAVASLAECRLCPRDCAMHGQVGRLVFDERGLATRGVLVRHLVMPGLVHETKACLEWLAARLGPGTYVNVMDQYYPAGKVSEARFEEIGRRVTTEEFAEARRCAHSLGLRLDQRWGAA